MGQQPLQGLHLAPPAGLRCLYDTGLEPTHGLVSFRPVNRMPVRPSVGSRTSRTRCCHLLCLLCPFAKRSRKERPDGSQPACAGGTVPLSVPLQSGVRFLHPPIPHADRLPLRFAFPCGRRVGLPRSVSVSSNGVGPACSPVTLRLR